MNWQEVCDHPALQNLPFKIELNQQGQIVMSPVRIAHTIYQGELRRILDKMLLEGLAIPAIAIHTREGTKVADVAWCSEERLKQIKEDIDAHIAPEICVEVLSESNTPQEMNTKRQLYFEQGAEEVWICDQNGQITFYDLQGSLKASKKAPNFPQHIKI